MRDRTARVASTTGPAIATVVARIVGVIGFTAAAGFVAVAPAAADGEVSIEVLANGKPADSAPGPTVESGATVNLRYVITVGAAEPLYDFLVTNQTGDAEPDCDLDDDGRPDGTNNHPGPLEAGESFFCVTSLVAGDPGITYASVGRVTAYNSAITETFTNEDAAHYTTVRPTTTQTPTTQAPTTEAPTTSVPTTAAPPTAAPTTRASTTTSVTLTTSTRPPSSTTSSSASTSSTTTEQTPLAEASNEDAAAPEELAATTDDESGGFPLWWVVLAFAAGGGIAAGVGSRLADKKATAPDQ